MCGEVWDAIHALVESESIMYDAFLGLTLQVLNLLPQIPIDISFHMQILLPTVWNPPFIGSGILSLSRMAFHLSTRKSGCPTFYLRSWLE